MNPPPVPPPSGEPAIPAPPAARDMAPKMALRNIMPMTTMTIIQTKFMPLFPGVMFR